MATPACAGRNRRPGRPGSCTRPARSAASCSAPIFCQTRTTNVILRSSDVLNFIQSGGSLGGLGNLVLIDPNTQVPFLVQGQNQNLGTRLVTGLESSLAYQVPNARFGYFTFTLATNYFFSWKSIPAPGAVANNFLGGYNNGTLPLGPGAIPRLKGYFRTQWSWRNFEATGTVNYTGDFHDDPNFVGPTGTVPRRVSEYITFDLQLAYEFKRPRPTPTEMVGGKGARTAVASDQSGSFAQKLLWGTKVRVGVVNLFDRSPPSVLGAFNDNYDTALYSLRNRYVYVGLNKRF